MALGRGLMGALGPRVGAAPCTWSSLPSLPGEGPGQASGAQGVMDAMLKGPICEVPLGP